MNNDFVAEHLELWQAAEIIERAVIERFPDHASQDDMDRVVAAIRKIKAMTTSDMIKSLEKYDLHPSSSAARIIVGGLLAELVLARDMGLVYGSLKVKGDVNETLLARERLKAPQTTFDDFQKEEK